MKSIKSPNMVYGIVKNQKLPELSISESSRVFQNVPKFFREYKKEATNTRNNKKY